MVYFSGLRYPLRQ